LFSNITINYFINYTNTNLVDFCVVTQATVLNLFHYVIVRVLASSVLNWLLNVFFRAIRRALVLFTIAFILQPTIVMIFMAAMRGRCGYYIFVLFLLSSFFFSSPNLSGRRLDVHHTSTHGVALVRI